MAPAVCYPSRMPDVEQLIAEVLALPDVDRLTLAHRLLDSLGDGPAADQEYDEVLRRRQERVRTGAAVIRDWSEVEKVVEQLRGQTH